MPDGEYIFSLIDTNRMIFRRRISQRARFINLRRLSCKVEAYLCIVRRYAEWVRTDPGRSILQGVFGRLLFEERQQLKAAVRQRIRR